jgi:DMSO/TMAO reductase YedYZ molybdopterin-dependent catalytic subunit
VRSDGQHGSAGAAAGALGAAVALAFGWWVAALARQPSPVGNVASVVIDRAPHWLVEFAIDVFSTNDKLALGIGVVVVTLLVGAAVGRSSTRRRGPVIAAYAAFALVGWAAAVDRPDAAARSGLFIVAGAALAGVLTHASIVWSARPRPTGGPGSPVAPDRRRFLGLSVAAGVAAVGFTAAARRVVNGAAVAARRAVTLPRPRRPLAPVPAGASFDVAGITPIVTPNDRFYRIDTAFFVPRVDPADWTLSVSGLVERPLTIHYDDLLRGPLVERYVTLTCVSNEVGGQLAGNAKWLGVPLADILERARPAPGAEQVVGRSVDGWTAGFPIEAANDGRTALVAVGMNGEPLPFAHGFPARLVVEGLYGYVSATKWLREITLTTWDGFDGYWIPRGWAKKGPIKVQSRIDVPRAGSVPAGRTTIAGVAWAQGRGISRVDVRVDGDRWREADLAASLGPATWRQWRAVVDLRPGEHALEVRATDGRGVTQTAVRQPPAPDGATGYHRRRVRAV